MSIFRSYGSGRDSLTRQSVSMLLGVFLLLQHLLLITPAAANAAPVVISPNIVISQVYGGGGNSGATLTNDFIEVFNRGSASVSVTGWSVQYASAAGTTWSKTDLAGSIPPGAYYLIQQAAGAGGTTPLPTPDSAGSIAMSATAGKVALVSSTTLLSGSCPTGVIDFVGYGSTANCFEGTPTPNLSNPTAALRKGGGCTETDVNSADFSVLAPTPRNSSSPLNSCGGPTNPAGVGAANPSLLPAGASTLLTVTVTPGTEPVSTGLAVSGNLSAIGGSASQQFFDNATNGDVTAGDNIFSYLATVGVLTTGGAKSIPTSITDAQARSGNANISLTIEPPVLAIHTIQGNGNLSPFAGSLATTTGIVTGKKTNGFFIQEPDATIDADPNTSEGIFVFTGSAPAVAVGDSVKVTGSLVEFVSSTDPSSPTITEFTSSPSVTVLSSGNPLPAPIVITAADTLVNDINNLERYEFMRVQVDSLTVVAPTEGFVSEANATSTSNGIFYGVITGIARPFREPGIQVPNPVPAPMPPNVPRFDANPELIRVDGDGQPGVAPIDVTTGAIVTDIVGPLDYGARSYTILPDFTPAFSGNISSTPVSSMGDKEFTVSTLNMERFYDTVNDPSTSDAVLTPAAFNNRLNKASLLIRNIMRSPDIIGIVEMENLSTLQAVADRINMDAITAGDPNPNYQAYLEEGIDVGGIDVGFLVKSTPRVNVIDVIQFGKTATYINPNNGQPAPLNDRPPLVLRAMIQPANGDAFPVTVIVNHLRSLGGVEDPLDGARVRAKRRAQAEYLADLIKARQVADPTERIISVGDYNAFQFNDGLVDSIGTIKGTPTAADQVVAPSPDLVDPDLVDLGSYSPSGEHYSFIFNGNAQELDHVLVTGNLLPRFSRIEYARANADFPEVFRNNAAAPERLSDHDGVIAYFTFPNADLSITKGASTGSPLTGSSLTYTLTVTNSMDDPATDAVVTDMLPAGTTFVSAMAPAGWSCTTPAVGGTGTVSCSNPAFASNASEEITIVVSIDCDLANGTEIENTATVEASILDPDLSNNTQTVSVVASNPPPMITGLSVDKPSIWPPNHQFVDVTVSYGVQDNCGAVSCSISVTSNEPENGTGDGDTAPDWEIVDDHLVRLRAERAGTGNGRIYTITVTCIDSAGNTSSSSIQVVVPKNKGK